MGGPKIQSPTMPPFFYLDLYCLVSCYGVKLGACIILYTRTENLPSLGYTDVYIYICIYIYIFNLFVIRNHVFIYSCIY